jgi:deoxyribonuclease IV
MRTGVHLGLATGYTEATNYAGQLGCNCVQIFTHSPRSFSFKELNHEELKKLHSGWKQHRINPVASHCSYLINLASLDNKTFYGSIGTVKKELEYAKAFGCEYFVLHVGKHKDATLRQGMEQIAKAFEKLKEDIIKNSVMVLFETVAGQGTEIGMKFEELNELMEMIDKDLSPHIGVCVDTCHIFAAGYDIRTKEGVEATLKAMEKTFGIRKVKLIHVNDSKGELGDRLDRHEHIGLGHIGYDGLKAFLTHPKIRDIPMVLETPIDEQGDQKDDLEKLNSMFR